VIRIGASDGRSERGSYVPPFVSEEIERELLAYSRTGESMVNLFNTLLQNEFKVVKSVASDAILAFVNEVEFPGQFELFHID
jgi:hypothetical protein